MDLKGGSLMWRELSANSSLEFHSLLEEEALVDVSLAVEGTVIKAHKLILSACSPYFQKMFEMNPCRHPIVWMRETNLDMMTHLLNFMYKGKVKLREDDVSDFLRLAEALQIRGCRGLLSEDVPTKEKEGKNIEIHQKLVPRKRIKKRRSKQERVVEVNVGTEWDDIQTDSDSDSPLSKLMTGDVQVDVITADKKPKIRVKGESSMLENCEAQTTAEVEQGGIDYEMLQSERGREMLLYQGYLFAQNRMCTDGIRWQCNYRPCNAYCRTSSAGWLTPINTRHDHEKPPDSEIKRRILRMQLKMRAASSGETPGEIIRNIMPDEDVETQEQRATLKRCIQRYRKKKFRGAATTAISGTKSGTPEPHANDTLEVEASWPDRPQTRADGKHEVEPQCQWEIQQLKDEYEV